ncbi:MAG TPA: hypothetical protein VJK04_03055 [Candidatus Paceibacterota bacterium]
MLQIAQLKLGTAVTHGWLMLETWNAGMERAKHDRDQHRGSWDVNYALKCQKVYRNKAEELQKQFNANQEYLKELKDEVVVLLVAPH